jgi:hypothetical protein
MFDGFGISCMTTDNFCFYLQNRHIQTSQTGGQRYNDISPFSIPWYLVTSLNSFIVPTPGDKKPFLNICWGVKETPRQQVGAVA